MYWWELGMEQKMNNFAIVSWCHYCKKELNKHGKERWQYIVVAKSRLIPDKLFCSMRCIKSYYIEVSSNGIKKKREKYV